MYVQVHNFCKFMYTTIVFILINLPWPASLLLDSHFFSPLSGHIVLCAGFALKGCLCSRCLIIRLQVAPPRSSSFPSPPAATPGFAHIAAWCPPTPSSTTRRGVFIVIVLVCLVAQLEQVVRADQSFVRCQRGTALACS